MIFLILLFFKNKKGIIGKKGNRVVRHYKVNSAFGEAKSVEWHYCKKRESVVSTRRTEPGTQENILSVCFLFRSVGCIF